METTLEKVTLPCPGCDPGFGGKVSREACVVCDAAGKVERIR